MLCPFCMSEMKVGATVCGSCGAEEESACWIGFFKYVVLGFVCMVFVGWLYSSFL